MFKSYGQIEPMLKSNNTLLPPEPLNNTFNDNEPELGSNENPHDNNSVEVEQEPRYKPGERLRETVLKKIKQRAKPADKEKKLSRRLKNIFP